MTTALSASLPTDPKTGLTLPLSKSRAWQVSARMDRQILIQGDTAIIPLTQGFVAVIDAADVAMAQRHMWHVHRSSGGTYARTWVRTADGSRRGLMLHSAITGFAITDHRDGNGLNNRRVNLREADRVQNNRNSRVQKNNRCGFKGVSQTPSGRWRARIAADGVQRALGSFDSPEAAHRAYCEASGKLHGEFGRTA